MRIPLDYYRILGLPIQATPEQLQQAHRDRTLQLPRREYSDAAIAARRRLLDQAYAVLTDLASRQRYDASFLAKTYNYVPGTGIDLSSGADATADADIGIDPHAPSIDIEDADLIGALLILQELGEYELVLKLGRPFVTGGSASVNQHQFGDPNLIYPDIVLTVALACLELGREQWQQNQSENAAEALETGYQLLMREGLFVGVRSEIQSDLYRLRPYRILELLASPEDGSPRRQQGMQLLQDILDDRGGIDGDGNDQSGMNIDDFLRFIQQIRGYLTAAEQQQLFERESARPSAVATYLAAYAMLSRGFAERQADLVRQAQGVLTRLSRRQDVHLERSVCALLLGQTETAIQELSRSQEQGSLAFIQEHSYESDDLLPGLCLYTEHWLRDEVFPHFRDLADQSASLKSYFADPVVQAYLERLPQPVDGIPQPEAPSPSRPPEPTFLETERPAANGASASVVRSHREQDGFSTSPNSIRTEIDDRTKALLEQAGIGLGQSSTSAKSTVTDAESVTTAVRAERQPKERGGSRSNSPRRERATDDRPGKWRSLLPLGLILLALIGVGTGLAWLVRSWQMRPTEQVGVAPSPSPTASPTTSANLATQPLDVATAQRLIETWLSTKAAAMGSNHDASQLEQILAEPKLSVWQKLAAEEKQSNSHREYQHVVKVQSVDLSSSEPTSGPSPVENPEGEPSPSPSPTPANQAKVIAQVKETMEQFDANGSKGAPTTEELTIQYSLVQANGQWRISTWELQ